MKLLKQYVGDRTNNPKNLINFIELRQHNFLFFKRYSIIKDISLSFVIHWFKTQKEAEDNLSELIKDKMIKET